MCGDASLRPRQCDGTTIDPEEDGVFVIVAHDRETLCVTNETGRLIVELCDGIRTVDDIAGELSSRFDVDVERASADVTAFVRTAVEKGILV